MTTSLLRPRDALKVVVTIFLQQRGALRLRILIDGVLIYPESHQDPHATHARLALLLVAHVSPAHASLL